MIDNKCSFNHIYKFDADHVIDGVSVKDIRCRLGKRVASFLQASGTKFDIISAIPNTGYFYAEEIAESLGIEFRRIFEKISGKRTLGQTEAKRILDYQTLLIASDKVPHNSHVLFIDEALLSGVTVRIIANACKQLGIHNYSFAFMSPVTYGQCPWDHIKNTHRQFASLTDTASGETRMILIEKFKKEIGAQSVFFCPEALFYEVIDDSKTCTLCFYDDLSNVPVNAD